eukprot:scaffold19060_cov56-Isochrysis_galbana.AAC.1
MCIRDSPYSCQEDRMFFFGRRSEVKSLPRARYDSSNSFEGGSRFSSHFHMPSLLSVDIICAMAGVTPPPLRSYPQYPRIPCAMAGVRREPPLPGHHPQFPCPSLPSSPPLHRDPVCKVFLPKPPIQPPMKPRSQASHSA